MRKQVKLMTLLFGVSCTESFDLRDNGRVQCGMLKQDLSFVLLDPVQILSYQMSVGSRKVFARTG